MTTVVSTTRTDILEQLFQRLEEESEIRALANEDAAVDPPAPTTEQEAQEAVDVLPSPLPEPTVRAAKDRRRGSISISRYGGPVADQNSSAESRIHSTRPSRSSSVVDQKPTFYQLNSQPKAHLGSADSLASNSGDPSQYIEEPNLTTQMEKIQPARSISRAISRRLSRARDIPLPSPSSTSTLIIDVAVEEATHESHSMDGAPRVTVTTATLRTQRSTPGLYDRGLAGGSSNSNGWMSKAKDITSKFRRRSLAALIGPAPVR